MSSREINQKNLYLILPGKVSRMAMMYAADSGLSLIEAMKRIYKSKIYRELEDVSSKLWHYGPVAFYQIFLENK